MTGMKLFVTLQTVPIYEEQRAFWSDKIRAATEGLPLYKGWPGVDYSKAPEAFAVNLTLLHDPEWRKEGRPHSPRPETEVLIARRGAGHRSFSGISGYVDEPERNNPITFTARQELQEEAGVSDTDLDAIDFYLGKPFTLPHRYEGDEYGSGKRTKEGILHLLPMIGICFEPNKPTITPDGHEITEHQWVPLGQIMEWPERAPGYAEQTLPHALGALVTSQDELSEALGVPLGQEWPNLNI